MKRGMKKKTEDDRRRRDGKMINTVLVASSGHKLSQSFRKTSSVKKNCQNALLIYAF